MCQNKQKKKEQWNHCMKIQTYIKIKQIVLTLFVCKSFLGVFAVFFACCLWYEFVFFCFKLRNCEYAHFCIHISFLGLFMFCVFLFFEKYQINSNKIFFVTKQKKTKLKHFVIPIKDPPKRHSISNWRVVPHF